MCIRDRPRQETSARASAEPEPGRHRRSTAETSTSHRKSACEFHPARYETCNEVPGPTGVAGQTRQRRHPLRGRSPAHETRTATLAGTPVLHELKRGSDVGRRTSGLGSDFEGIQISDFRFQTLRRGPVSYTHLTLPTS